MLHAFRRTRSPIQRKPARAVPSALAAAALAAAALAGPANADDDRGAVRLVKSIPIPTTLAPLRSFDISWVDAPSQRYYLADRSNKSVDVVDAKTGTFIKAISGGFSGVHFNSAGGANNDIAGPNGVVVSGRWLFVTDAPSRVVTIDLNTDTVVSTASTSSSSNRADELAYDPSSGTLLAINNADSPPFGTLIKVNKANGQLTVVKQIIFDMSHSGFDATNGAEQPQWDSATHRFYVSIPEINCNVAAQCGGKFPLGAVARINPVSGIVDGLFPVQHCQPAGLTVGPKGDLLLGCGTAFDIAGNAWSASDPNTAAPISVIMDARSGSIDRMVPGVSGSDEVWFNSGDGQYYLAARSNPGGPVLGVIDARSQTLRQLVPTINTAGQPFAFPAGTAHSVAANSRNNEVFVPLSANNVFPMCLNGCIAVFAAPNDDRHDDRHDDHH